MIHAIAAVPSSAGMPPWAVVVGLALLATAGVVRSYMRMDPNLVDARTRRQLLKRAIKRSQRLGKEDLEGLMGEFLSRPGVNPSRRTEQEVPQLEPPPEGKHRNRRRESG